jgi:undecaprenyl pyrophosphate phosphatase UppP
MEPPVTDIINWKAELKKIEREYDTHGASGKPGRISANGLAATPLSPEELTNGAMLRIGLSLAVGIGIVFWPYAHDCGSALFSYLGAAVVVIIGGLWSVTWTWRGRMPRSHAISLVIVLWGLALGATQVLPRTGHVSLAGSAPSAGWFCPGNSPKEIIDEVMGSR